MDGLSWLVKSGLALEDKVVAMGWSYGGYMAARCLMHPESRGRDNLTEGATPSTPILSATGELIPGKFRWVES